MTATAATTNTATSPVEKSAGLIRSIRSHRAFPLVTLAGVSAVAAFSDAGADDGQVLCPYRLATGGWCPGCGCTRALGALIRGDFDGSLAYNPWTTLLFTQLVVMFGWIYAAPTQAKTWWRANNTKVLAANLVVITAIWAVRLAFGVIPLPFS